MIAQRFQEEFQKELTAKVYHPSTTITNSWRSAAMTAIEKASPAQLGVGADALKELYHALGQDKELTLMQFAIANNALENMSCDALRLTHDFAYYCNIQKEVEALAKDWTIKTSSIREAVQKRLNEEEKMKVAASGASILKPIIGEA